MIGDAFVNETFHAVKEIFVAAKGKWKETLYIQCEFNIDCYTANPLSMENNVLVRMLNAFIKALNDKECKRLPRIVIFVPDWDIVRYLGFYKSGAKPLFDEIINWMILNAERAIQSKKDSLSHKKPGAVVSSEPKVVWVKMIERVGGEFERALTVRYRFNAAMEDQLAKRRKHYILDIGKIIANPNLFNPNNSLNGDGQHLYWSELDKIIELFDDDHEILKPVWQTQFENKKNSSKHYKNSRSRHHSGSDKMRSSSRKPRSPKRRQTHR